MIKNIKEIIAIAIAAAFILFCSIDAAGCTSAIIGAEANPSGRPYIVETSRYECDRQQKWNT